jgi:glycosyltransferase involved in cell wall biosynthesis
MASDVRDCAIVVTSYPGQPTSADFERLSAAGERPRKDYVLLSRALDADVIDRDFMERRASRIARALPHWDRRPLGQLVELLLRRNEYGSVCVWSDRLGLPLALVYKLMRSRRDVVLISSWLTTGAKAFMLRRLRAHTHLGAIVSYSSAQLQIAASRLKVPPSKLHLALQPVDERFWQPDATPGADLIGSVGYEQRDYATLFRAVAGLGVEVQLAIGSGDRPAAALERRLATFDPPPNVRFSHLRPIELRRLYTSSRFIVMPLLDVDFDAGVTALAEAMSMGRAVIVTRTRGQIDLIRDGVEGIYVPPGDPSALRAAIARLLEHPDEAERMGRAGRALVERNHTLDGYVERVAAIIRAVARGIVEQGAAGPSDGRSP